ncbi:MAG: hypothetical protein M3146_03010 [Thermoproteota archaeon]|nr:hypothetical protein [Thermoproteota archaeon]
MCTKNAVIILIKRKLFAQQVRRFNCDYIDPLKLYGMHLQMSLMSFRMIVEELRANIDRNKAVIESSLKKNPAVVFSKVNEVAQFVGRKHNMQIRLHFPDSTKIREISAFGTENIGIVFDASRKSFPIPREEIKRKAEWLTNFIEARDAYMYEGKEGVRVLLKSGRLEIQPGAVHLWCKVDSEIADYVDWLMQYVYCAKQS